MSRRHWLPLLVVAACSGASTPAPSSPPGGDSTSSIGSSSPAPVSPPPPAGIKVTLADVGLEASSIDRTAEPCTDFYQFACGGWLANNPIPADRARWSRFTEVEEKTAAALLAILDAAARDGADPGTKKLGDYYAACMDEGAIARAGLGAIQPLLAKTTQVKDARSWMTALIALHRVAVPVVWTPSVHADLVESTIHVTYLDPSGLGLPDRDYYVAPDLQSTVVAYQAHVGTLLALVGVPAAKAGAAAADVVAIETELAKLTDPATERRDVTARYHPTDAKALARRARTVDWTAYWNALGTPSKKLVITTPKFFDALDELRTKFKPSQWASYFTYHLAATYASALPPAIEQQQFELQKLVTGVEQQRDRNKRCARATQLALGELLGAKYVERHFGDDRRKIATTLVDAVVEALGKELSQLEWMSEATRQAAAAKLAKLVRKVGYPDRWRTYDFDVEREDHAGNALRAAAFEVRRQLGKAGKPVDRSEWHMNVFDVDASYEPTQNTAALPAGILQSPFFDDKRAIAANMGGIGMVIGHVLTHGFDARGARFDADGNMQDWWQPEDARRFEERGQCVAQQYATFEAMPGGFVDGERTRGENIADLGGVELAFRAYRALRGDLRDRYIADGFTEDQQFFIAVAQAWCSHDRPAEIQRRLRIDPHAPPKFRVYGSLRNVKEFAEAFRCSPGTAMNPAKTCSVW